MEDKNTKETDSLTAVRHHVKNPLYILKGYLDSLVTGDLGEVNQKQEKYLKVCLDSVDKVDSIVERLLCVIEIEEGKYRLEKEEVNVVQTTKEAVEDNLFLARALNTKMSFTTEEDSLLVLVDKDKLKIVIDSLLANAMKYKDSGEGSVEVKVGKKEGEVFCSVRDDGIGVTEDEKEKIFDKFYRGKKAIEIDPNSLGLDLYITKVIVKGCAGRVWVEKNQEKGSTFYFILPLYKNQS